MKDISSPLHSALAKYFPHLSFPELRAKAREVRKWCEHMQCHIKLISDPVCHRLREIADPPPLVFVLGNAALLSLVSIAVVGTRRPSGYGLSAAVRFSRKLAESGFCIVSGLASGIDSAAHRGALLGGGYTVAVLGHGLDRVYPTANARLADEIVSGGGCLVSEYPPGVPPRQHHFPARNRIISGLSVGTFVVEAAVKSGSLITARQALEQNREVFVLPGRFDDAGFQGGHLLIQQGAKLVLNPQDLLDELPPLGTAVAQELPLEPRWERLADLFRPFEETATLEQLFSRAGPDRPTLVAELQAAEMAGLVMESSPQEFFWAGVEQG